LSREALGGRRGTVRRGSPRLIHFGVAMPGSSSGKAARRWRFPFP
jgi:hypothetical protein